MELPAKRTFSGSPRASSPGLRDGSSDDRDDGGSGLRSDDEASDDEDSDEEEWYEEEEWYDIYVRQPGGEAGNAEADIDVPPPDRTDNFTYVRAEGPCYRQAIGSYTVGTELTLLSSGLAVWDASVHLCRYLMSDPHLGQSTRVLELGSGTGRAGLLAHHLRRTTALRLDGSLTMLTDGDLNALANLRQNVWGNTSPEDDGKIAVRQLIWGEESGRVFSEIHGEFDYVMGSDLLYLNHLAIHQLFQTVNNVMSKQGHQSNEGKFVLAHSIKHNVRLETVLNAAKFHYLVYEIADRIGDVYVVVYRRMTMSNIGPLLDRLHCANYGLRSEVNALRSANAGLEDRTRCLEGRIVELRGGDVRSDIVGLDEDVFIDVAAFLGTSDLAALATTCRHFGLKTHRIRLDVGRFVSLVERMAYSEYNTATDEERLCLTVYDPEDNGDNRSVLFYRNELVMLRKPLVFDQILGVGVAHSFGDKAKLVRNNEEGRVKRTVSRLD